MVEPTVQYSVELLEVIVILKALQPEPGWQANNREWMGYPKS